MRNKSLLFIILLLCVSCNLDDYEPNPFLGSWYNNESFYDEGVTVNSNTVLTFFKDFTYTVEVKLSTYAASKTFTYLGEYEFEDSKVWLNDNNSYFGDGSGFFNYQIIDNVLKISAKNETKVFRR